VNNCHACGRRIPHAQLFCMIDTSNIGTADAPVCINCMQNSSHLHAMLLPGCPERWHDLYDHAALCRWKRVGA
jgi:hypothetical protein